MWRGTERWFDIGPSGADIESGAEWEMGACSSSGANLWRGGTF